MVNNRKANLFIVGAMKAGTTSFCETIGEHPDIFFAPIKEPNYFVNDLPLHIFKESPYFSIDNYFENEFPQPLHIANIQTEIHYSRLFELAKAEKYLAEGSTAYLHATESASLIHEYNPDAKIIILVRDGLKRAFSHYKMDVGLGRTIKSFEELLQKDLNDRGNGIINDWSYLGMSIYYENVQRYKKYFGQNVLVLNFDTFIKHQEREFEKLYLFLGIKKLQLSLKRTNESANFRFKKGLYFLKQSGLKDFLSNWLPIKLRHRIFKSMQKSDPQVMNLSEKMRSDLEKIFLRDQVKLNSEC